MMRIKSDRNNEKNVIAISECHVGLPDDILRIL